MVEATLMAVLLVTLERAEEGRLQEGGKTEVSQSRKVF